MYRVISGRKRYKAVLKDTFVRMFSYNEVEHLYREKPQKVGGFTVAQWQVLEKTAAPNVDALVLEFSKAEVESPSRSLCASYLEQDDESEANLTSQIITLSVGALRQWLESRKRPALREQGILSPTIYVCAGYRGLDDDDAEELQVVWVRESNMTTMGKLDPNDEDFDMYTDGTHKTTERRLLWCNENAPLPKSKAEKKTNALLMITHGWSSVHLRAGAVESKRGWLKKYRASFNEISISHYRGGEATQAFKFQFETELEYVKEYHPDLVARLTRPTTVMADFSDGCIAAYAEVYGARKTDDYTFEDGHCIPNAQCLLKNCALHAIRDSTDKAHAGYGHLVGDNKAAAAERLANLMRISGRRFPLQLFDFFWRTTGSELEAGTVPGVGEQPNWKTYFFKEKLLEEIVDGVPLLNATWRVGPDRKRGPGDTNNLSEGRHNWYKSRSRQVAMHLFQKNKGPGSRPNLPQYMRHLDYNSQIDWATNPKKDLVVFHTKPISIDDVHRTGHKSVALHSWRLPAINFVQEYEKNTEVIQRIDKGKRHYFVMAFGCDDENEHAPKPVSAGKANELVELLTMPLSWEERTAWMQRHGYLNNGHISSTKLQDVYDNYAVVCVEPDRIAHARCLTACDESLNHFGCEHCVVARHLMGDKDANPQPSKITSEAAKSRMPGAPQRLVLGGPLTSEASAEMQASKKRKTSAEQWRGRLGSPPRDFLEEAAATRSQDRYNELHDLSKVFLSAPPDRNRVMVPRQGKTELRLWTGSQSVAMWRKCLSSLEAASVLEKRTFRWKDCVDNLALGRLARVYKEHHPLKAIAGLASDVLSILEDLVRFEVHRSSEQDATIGDHRCAGQEGFPSISLPDGCVQAVQRYLAKAEKAFYGLLLAKRTDTGFIVTDIRVPSCEEDETGRVAIVLKSFQQQLADADLSLVGLISGKHSLPEPSQNDAEVFEQLCSQYCSCCFMLVSGATSCRRFCFPASLAKKLTNKECGHGEVALAELAPTTFVQRVFDGSTASLFPIEKWGGHVFMKPVRKSEAAARCNTCVWRKLEDAYHIPSDILNALVDGIEAKFGKDKALEIMQEEWLADLHERWVPFVATILEHRPQEDGAAALSQPEILKEFQNLLFAIVRLVIKGSNEIAPVNFKRTDKQQLAKLKSEGFVWREASGVNCNCLIDGLVIGLTHLGYIEFPAARDAALQDIRRYLVDTPGLHPKTAQGQKKASAYLEHGLHADPIVRELHRKYELHPLPPYGFCLQVHARFDEEGQELCQSESTDVSSSVVSVV